MSRETASKLEKSGTRTIFLLEDDPDISRLVCHHLEAAGYLVRSYSRGTNLIPDAVRERPSLILLDIMIPDGDGMEICRHIRAAGGPLARTPIVFLTARSSEKDRIIGLELGADDYVSKPFSPNELVARIRAVLRRSEGHLGPERIKVGELEIDSSAMTVTVRGNQVATTATEFRLLQYLASNAGRAVTRDQILDAVWSGSTFVGPRSVDVYIRKLREKIELDPERPQYLRTLRGTGYRFEFSR
jgi:two-component system phosphate regulon response regulator PhoB